jgi:hypothetical protein
MKGGRPSTKANCNQDEPNESPSSSTSSSTSSSDIQTAFTTFWTCYPRKVGKPNALKSWMRVFKSGPDEALFRSIMQALTQHKRLPQWTKDDGQFIPHPATWLNQQRWEDVLSVGEGRVRGAKPNGSKFQGIEDAHTFSTEEGDGAAAGRGSNGAFGEAEVRSAAAAALSEMSKKGTHGDAAGKDADAL